MHPKQEHQSIYSQEAISCRPSTEQQSTALRFSFSGCLGDSYEEPNTAHDKNDSLNRSFSGLIVQVPESEIPGEKPGDQTVTAKPFVPVLSKPRKKKEGYGFSYSETFWQDSFEYPDTEIGGEPEDERTEPDTESPATGQRDFEWGFAGDTVQSSYGGSTVVATERSFDDLVVLRDVGSFHIAKPQRVLSCTAATREDTVHVKTWAKSLCGMYVESIDIQAGLLSRLERMVSSQQQNKGLNNQAKALSITDCTVKLLDFLRKAQKGRVETGENPRFVEHEIQWASWLVKASRQGVMHLRVPGCKCRPDWEE